MSVLILVATACAARAAGPTAEPAPLPPQVSLQGVYEDPDACFSIELPPGTHVEHAESGGRDVLAADTDKGIVVVLSWRQAKSPTAEEMDDLLLSTARAGFALEGTPTDKAIEGTTRGRAVRFRQAGKGAGEMRIAARDPWVVILIVFAHSGTPFERDAPRVLESFRLLPPR